MGKWLRSEALSAAPPFETWPQVLIEALDAPMREKYLARADAMRRYFANEPVLKIAQVTGVPACRLPFLAKRCLTIADDGMIAGLRALIPYVRFKEYNRTAEIQIKFSEDRGGMAGAMRKLFSRFPQIEETLVRHIRQDAKSRQVHEFNIRPRDLHRIFIRLVKELGVKDNEWPLNTKFLGQRSIQKYMADILARNFSAAVWTRGSQEAKAHLSVGTGHEAFLVYDEPYSAVEIDANYIDCHLTVSMETPMGTTTDILLDRLWLIAAVDRFSTAILAYSVVYRSQVTADDVLSVISKAVSHQWKPYPLTIPVKYPSGGGLPSGIIDEALGVSWTVLLLDGALAHLSAAVHMRARKTLGFSINWGPVGHFERRPNVEKTFDKIAKEIFKRLPSSTGSGPDKGRPIDAEKKALRHRIQAFEVVQLLDIVTAQHNVLPSSGAFFLSPLDILRQYLCDTERNFLPRHLPQSVMDHAKKFTLRMQKTVRGGLNTGRRPYIELDGAKYTSPVLTNAGYLLGQKLWIEIDEADYRQITAYLENGAEIGVLKAQGKWGQTKHTRKTRKAINSLVSKRVLILSEFDDPIQEYMRFISNPRPGKSADKISSRQATQLTALANEADVAPRIPSQKPSVAIKEVTSAPSSNRLLAAPSNFFSKVKNRK